ncbi:siderophore-interacting protein [Agromyces mediolanus]|uniref:siderophore-interacting protein n=1 Tax=Agromyces mediolanus TaxID=41986 RepID=UPI001E37413D|nr:siderophore-interacting protein [Agromyces mediolanus]MCD1571537.1 siderophore-interacting protein [Agromyces mediolanus]
MAEHSVRVRPPQRPRRTGARVFAARVVAVRDLSPHFRRLTLTAAEFADYAPAGPDEYLGLLLPRDERAALVLPANDGTENIRAAVAAIPEEERPELRWYTLRDHRPEDREIDIDFVVHGDEGPGTRFARRARAGSSLGVRECSALYAPPSEMRTRVLVGDESSLPAIARILETTDAGETHVFIEISDAAEKQDLPGGAVTWVEREGEPPGARLYRAVREAELPDAIDYAWVCGERLAVQELRRHLVARGVPKDRITFSGYWRLGEARG